MIINTSSYNNIKSKFAEVNCVCRLFTYLRMYELIGFRFTWVRIKSDILFDFRVVCSKDLFWKIYGICSRLINYEIRSKLNVFITRFLWDKNSDGKNRARVLLRLRLLEKFLANSANKNVRYRCRRLVKHWSCYVKIYDRNFLDLSMECLCDSLTYVLAFMCELKLSFLGKLAWIISWNFLRGIFTLLKKGREMKW